MQRLRDLVPLASLPMKRVMQSHVKMPRLSRQSSKVDAHRRSIKRDFRTELVHRARVTIQMIGKYHIFKVLRF